MGDPVNQPAYLEIKTSNASGVCASGADPTHIAHVLSASANSTNTYRAETLLGIDFPVNGLGNLSGECTYTGSTKGCPSWQMDFPCFQMAAEGAQDNNFNVPLFSFGKFQVGLKPSGEIDGGFQINGRSNDKENGTFYSYGNANGKPWYSNGQTTMYYGDSSAADAWFLADEPPNGSFTGASLWSSAYTANTYPWTATWGGGTVTKNASSGTYALKGDAYVQVANTLGDVDVYHTSGELGSSGWAQERKLTFMYSTPQVQPAFGGYGHFIQLQNLIQVPMVYGNIGIILGGGGGWKYSNSNDATFAGPPKKGAGYIGPCGITMGDADTLLPPKDRTGCAQSNGLFKNGRKMPQMQLTGCDAACLSPHLNNANPIADSTSPDRLPQNEPIYFFYTGEGSSFSGTMGRRGIMATNEYLTNLATCDPKGFFTFQRRAYNPPFRKDSVSPDDVPSLTDPRRLMLGYSPVAVDSQIYTFSDYSPSPGSVSGTANAVTAWGNTTPFRPDGWKPTGRLDFGDAGHSGDLLLYGQGEKEAGVDWEFHHGTNHACGDPHIKPLFGFRYDL
jgi:hypothetical protein